MKIKNFKNNIENNISGSMRVSTSTAKTKIKSVGVDAHVHLSNKQGITLIALIITIILMLILAGVVLNLTIGENGLFGTAKYSVKKWNNSVEQENAELDKLYAYINEESLPQNTKDTIAGTLVAIPDGWKTSTPTYVSTPDGKEVVSSKTISTVQAVATGEGETVPVPLGFYYVGGKVDTGVVISDNIGDKYDGKVDKTTHEYAPSLQGNQFVWIPCSLNDYKKTTTFTQVYDNGIWGLTAQNAYFDQTTNSAEKVQIEKYGGFYVARYEAGTSNIKGINFKEISTTTWTSNDALYTNVTSGNVTSKANEIPYYHANYQTAVEMSERMYRTDSQRSKYVSSGLITGTQWDVMINVMNSKEGGNLLTTDWGNFNDTESINLRGSHCIVDSNGGHGSWVITDNSYKKDVNENVLLTTGSNEKFQKMHLYDVSGNMWEWSEETAFFNYNYQAQMIRGGGINSNWGLTAAFRCFYPVTNSETLAGFRVVLYMK